MNKRIVLFTMILVLLVASFPLYADSPINIDVKLKQDKIKGNEYSFELEYVVTNGKKGDSFIIDTPFPVYIEGGKFLEVVTIGDTSYELTLTDDWESIKGTVGGKKTVHSSGDLKPIIVDGQVIKDNYPQIEAPGDSGTAQRDRIYKLGEVNGNIISWEVVIGGDGEGVPYTEVTDDIGNGHVLLEDTVKFHILDIYGNYNDDLVDMVISNIDTTQTSIDFVIEQLGYGEILLLEYQTEILDSTQKEFSNQLIISGEKKITESVIIEDWSDIDGDKPTKPTEPTDPTLPQVGESIFKWEYLIALTLLVVGIYLKRTKKTKKDIQKTIDIDEQE